jgi:Mrp family chromosome partitioning ATPase/uncharacterized protein involved in exopolysaccharide biosynthesis
MSRPGGQFVPSQQLRAGDNASGAASAESSPSLGGEQPFFRLDLMRSLQLHRRLALWITMAGLALAAGYVALFWPVYTAVSQVYIQPISFKLMDQGNGSHWPDDANTYDSFIEQQVQSASHPDVLLAVLHKLKQGDWQRSNESEQAAAERLGKSIEVARIGSSYEVKISAMARTPELSAQIANAMASSIVAKASREEKAGNSERLAILEEEQERVQKELDADRAEQSSLNAKLGVAAIGVSTPDHYDDEISKIHEELVKARTARDDAEARLISMGDDRVFASKALNAEADELVDQDPGLVSMKTSLNEQRAGLITQMANLTPNHPQYKQDAAQLAKIDTNLDSMTKDLRSRASQRIEQRLRNDLDRTAGVEAKLNGQLSQLAGAAASATPKLQRANDLATNIVRLQNRHASVDEQLHNLLLEDSVPGAAHLSAAAMPPLHPSFSGIARRALPMAFGGLLLGLLAALIANNLDPKIYAASDIEHVLGFGPMAQLPDFSEVSSGVAEEHLLRLSATIEHARQLGNLKSCLFTGATSGAGATTVAGRVSSMLESMGRETVLVDASWTPPPPATPRASPGSLGLNEPSNQLVTQRGSRSTALLQQLSKEAETSQEGLVVTDTAPLGVSAETEYLARFVDAVIVVVESGVTTRDQLREAAARLQRLEVPAVGFVLNRVGLEKADPAFRRTVRDTERYLRAQSRFQKSSSETVHRPRKPEATTDASSSMHQIGNQPKPETHVFYLPEWKATNPLGDVEAARAEAKRLGYEVVER